MSSADNRPSRPIPQAVIKQRYPMVYFPLSRIDNRKLNYPLNPCLSAETNQPWLRISFNERQGLKMDVRQPTLKQEIFQLATEIDSQTIGYKLIPQTIATVVDHVILFDSEWYFARISGLCWRPNSRISLVRAQIYFPNPKAVPQLR